LHQSFIRFGTSIATTCPLGQLWDKLEQKVKREKKEPDIKNIMFAIGVVM
jgi:hypothetical protein